jgi:formate-dependent nitrite reductase membrane component NrfD
MVSASDGWIVGADGIYHWQAAVFPADYLVAVVAATVAVIFFVSLVYLKKRRTSGVNVVKNP